jgi:nitrate reductase gamma subunit
MTLLEFARGPALQASLIIFVLGVLWRLVGVLLLPWRLVAAEPRLGAPSAFRSALKGVVTKMWPYAPFQKAALFTFVNGYVFHVGLAVVVFLFAPHVLFIKSLTGLAWPTLPSNVVAMVGVITAVSLIGALVQRLSSPVMQLISRADDYLSWLLTFLPVATGLLATLHLGARYETLLSLHLLSLSAFFVWFPFGKLMHAFLFAVSRGMTGVRLGQRGAEI